MANEEISHEELWDDSALQSSWDGALAEYQKYHSLASKGEKVNIEDYQSIERDIQIVKNLDKQRAINGGKAATKPTELALGETVNAAIKQSPIPPRQSAASDATPSQTAAIPQALLGSVQDEGLKNLMMSWYYAGYYTGLYEGQQKAHASMQQGD